LLMSFQKEDVLGDGYNLFRRVRYISIGLKYAITVKGEYKFPPAFFMSECETY